MFYLWLFIVLVLGSTAEEGSCNQKKRILFFAPPAQSHVVPLREIAVALVKDYPQYKITFVTGGKYINMTKGSGIETLDGVGSDPVCSQWTDSPEWSEAISAMVKSSGENTTILLNLIFVKFYDCTFDYLEKILLLEKPDFVMMDFVTGAMRDLCEKYKIDFGYNAMIGVAGFQSQMFLPNHLKARPLQEMHSIYSRFENFQFLFKMILQGSTLHKIIDVPRISRGFPPFDFSSFRTQYNNKLVIVPEFFGFVPGRPIDPLTRLVGFLVPPPNTTRASTHNVDHSVFEWLNSIPETGFVVYIAFGSVAIIEPNFFETILTGIENLKNQTIYVLCSLRKEVIINRENGLFFKRAEWVSQPDVLDHRRVKLFVTHGGLSSVGESVHSEVPMVLIPLFAEQSRNAYLIQDAGAGLAVEHSDGFTSDEITNSAFRIISNYSFYVKSLKKLHKLSVNAGGGKAAAKHIHEYLEVGDCWKNIELEFSVIERYQLDIFGIFFGIVFLIFYSIYKTTKWLVFKMFCRTKKSCVPKVRK